MHECFIIILLIYLQADLVTSGHLDVFDSQATNFLSALSQERCDHRESYEALRSPGKTCVCACGVVSDVVCLSWASLVLNVLYGR